MTGILLMSEKEKKKNLRFVLLSVGMEEKQETPPMSLHGGWRTGKLLHDQGRREDFPVDRKSLLHPGR